VPASGGGRRWWRCGCWRAEVEVEVEVLPGGGAGGGAGGGGRWWRRRRPAGGVQGGRPVGPLAGGSIFFLFLKMPSAES
jgi:hypothetical protein